MNTEETKNETTENNSENTENNSENNPKTTGKQPENSLQTTQISIRGLKTDKDYITALAVEKGLTVGQALSHIIELSQKQPEVKELIKEIEKPVIEFKPISIKENQALITFNPGTLEKINVCKPLIEKSSMPFDREDPESFYNALSNFCVNKVLESKFPQALRLFKVGKLKI